MTGSNTLQSELLSVEHLYKSFGGIQALTDYGLSLNQGELFGLIGPNGAGKTTVFNLLSGVLHPSSGRILFSGRDISSNRPYQNARLGLSRTFQNIRLFGDLTVEDNIKAAFHMPLGTHFWSTVLHLPGFMRSEREIARQAAECLHLLELAPYRQEKARNLPFGLQRRVEIARALASSPRLLLLDEPAAGMNPHETEDLMETIQSIHARYQLTICLVEHDMNVVMGICPRIQVLDQGRVLMEGSPQEIQNDPRVIKAYLGAPREECHAEN